MNHFSGPLHILTLSPKLLNFKVLTPSTVKSVNLKRPHSSRQEPPEPKFQNAPQPNTPKTQCNLQLLDLMWGGLGFRRASWIESECLGRDIKSMPCACSRVRFGVRSSDLEVHGLLGLGFTLRISCEGSRVQGLQD